MMDPAEVLSGIEATDLASLLYSFEKAITPPATPTPASVENQSEKLVPAPKAVLSAASTDKPTGSVTQARIRPTAVRSVPKPGISLLPFAVSPSTRLGPSSQVQSSPKIVIRASVPPLQSQLEGTQTSVHPRTAFRVVPSSHQTSSLLVVNQSQPLLTTVTPKEGSPSLLKLSVVGNPIPVLSRVGKDTTITTNTSLVAAHSNSSHGTLTSIKNSPRTYAVSSASVNTKSLRKTTAKTIAYNSSISSKTTSRNSPSSLSVVPSVTVNSSRRATVLPNTSVLHASLLAALQTTSKPLSSAGVALASTNSLNRTTTLSSSSTASSGTKSNHLKTSSPLSGASASTHGQKRTAISLEAYLKNKKKPETSPVCVTNTCKVPIRPAEQKVNLSNSSLLQSMLLDKSTGLLPNSQTSKGESVINSSHAIISSSLSDQADHDYCVHEYLKDPVSPKVLASDTLSSSKSKELEATSSSCKQARDSTVSEKELRTISSLDAELLQDIEYLDNTFGPAYSPVKELSNCDVLEDGEVMVDADGNDSFPSIDPSVSNQSLTSLDPTHRNFAIDTLNQDSMSETAVAFSVNGEELACGRRRGRRYRRRTELNNSPIREDKTDFFDKIPAYYTALAIPSKPTKTTIFASASKSLGTTDHLDIQVDEGEQIASGLFDKVPAHRRCFTNTAKDIDLNTPSGESVAQEDDSRCIEPMTSSLLSSSSTELCPEARSPQHGRARSRSRKHKRRRLHSYRSESSGGHHSRSRSRSRPRLVSLSPGRSRSGSAYSRNRSCSTCSSSSSDGSSCGSSCSGCSRSRSRSCSTCSSSGSSRSRSRSPQTKREWHLRGERSHMDRSSNRGHRERHSSGGIRRRRRETGSTSPADRAGWRSRSRRRRTHSRSTAVDEAAAERRRLKEEEKERAMEERRVVYVGKIPNSYTKRQLYRRFECFGEIKAVKINFREHGDNYGFVTFTYACDAIAAKEKGNNLEGVPKFDLCFGGRRRFCPDQYADLDGNREIEEEYAPMPKSMTDELDYASLLRQHSSQQKRAGKS